MRKNRIAALLLSLLMILGLLAGCGTAGSGSSPASQPATSQPSAPTEAPVAEPEVEPTAEPEPEGVVYPIAGDELELSCWTTFITNAGTYAESYNDWPAVALAEEKTGVHIEWLEFNPGNAGEGFQISVSSGEYPDMYRNFMRFYGSGAKAFDDEVIIRLNDLVDEYAPDYRAILDEDESCYKEAVDDDGNMWVMYSFITSFRNNGAMTIRQDMLDKLGREVPTTLAELTETMQAAKTEFGLTNTMFIHKDNYLGSVPMLAHSFGVPGLSAMNQAETIYQENGEVKFGTVQDGFKAYLQQMHEWYEMGIISHDFITASGNDKGEEAITTIGTDTLVSNSILELWPDYANMSGSDEFRLTGMATVGAEGKVVDHFISKSRLGNSNMAVTTSCDKPEVAVMWLNWWFSEEGMNVANYGEEGKTWEMVDGKKTFTDYITNEVPFDGLSVSQWANFNCLYNNVVGLMDEWRMMQFYTEQELAAMNTWAEYTDSEMKLPASVTLTSDESAAIGTKMADIQTYTSENMAKFINGDLDFDYWETFVSTIEEMGMQDIVDTYQAAYDRYLKR